MPDLTDDFSPVDHVPVTSDVVQEGLQAEHPVLQELTVKIITKPLLGRQRKTKMRKDGFELQQKNHIHFQTFLESS